MKYFRYKLKAFTLLEFLVVLTLSGIVVTIAYLVWDKAMQGFSIYDQSTKEYAELIRMKGALEDDFFEAKEVRMSNRGVHCVMNNGKQIDYDFTGGELLRSVDNEQWTIELEDVEANCFYHNEKQKESNGLVELLKIEFKKENTSESFIWRVNKKYGFSYFADLQN